MQDNDVSLNLLELGYLGEIWQQMGKYKKRLCSGSEKHRIL